MAKLPVVVQKLFGGSLPPSGNIAQPGSTVGGSTAYSGDPAVLQNLAAWLGGLAAQLVNASGGLNSQVLEEMNGILYVLTYQILYLKQAGIPEWDPSVTYYLGSWANVAGVPYVSKTDGNINHDPTSDATNWETFASTILNVSAPLSKAWVVFDGRSGAIDSSYNVASVTRTSAGVYQINFAANMADALYGFTGTAGTRPAVGFINGDDNDITGGAPGKTAVRTVSACTVFCYDRPNQTCEDAGFVMVNFFGNP